ncbi:mediator of RNA polymerase II transcription subunit 27 [Brachionus plicatilis]|uniref:Mediator of RNA polymerase II transcription subunit 27 n=1 Tax=Brachionus plicatilis TaxID=10195 RepID=A0A3M7QTX3_BRAPC|nr:mediator of RNA polymerase II transcription subunit 27 [Brachionus plicatilis]
MSTHIPIQNPMQRQGPGNMMPVQQGAGFANQSANQQQSTASALPHHSSQPVIDPDLKKIQDMYEAINLVENIKQDIHAILENVGKANSANNYANILNINKNIVDHQEVPKTAPVVAAVTGSIGTPLSVSNAYNQNPAANIQAETEQSSTNDNCEKNQNLNEDEAEFFEKTDNKFMQSKIIDINKSINDLDKIIKELQPITMLIPFQSSTPVQMWQSDFFSVLLDQQFEEKTTANSSKLLNKYRYLSKLQENFNLTSLGVYKRFQQSYSELKSAKPKPINRIFKKEELEKFISNLLGSPEFKVVAAQKSEHQFVLDIIMPQNFKFVFLFFDANVEKLQVRPLDSRILKIYANNKPSDEICFYDFDHKNKSLVFERLEKNCIIAWTFFKTEFGMNHLKNLMKWVKNFKDLFNAKCTRCEKHLLNGLPPTWRDLKTYQPYHDECRIF